MNLWHRSALRSYAIAFFTLAALDHVWAVIERPIASLTLALWPSPFSLPADATEEMVRSSLSFDIAVRAGAIFPWVEWVAILLICSIALRMRSFDWGADFFSYVVLVCIFMTVGREALGLNPGFTNPFGAKMVVSWLVVLCAAWVWNRYVRRS
jgi:hypothetical protein